LVSKEIFYQKHSYVIKNISVKLTRELSMLLMFVHK
jgi:hypothetical protein